MGLAWLASSRVRVWVMTRWRVLPRSLLFPAFQPAERTVAHLLCSQADLEGRAEKSPVRL